MGFGGFIKKAKTAAEATAAGAKVAKDVAAAGARGSMDQVKQQQADRKQKQQEDMEQRRAEWGVGGGGVPRGNPPHRQNPSVIQRRPRGRQ